MRTRPERSRRIWSVFRKSVREQKRDLMVLALSLASPARPLIACWSSTTT